MVFWENFQIGEIVYRAYSPVLVGKIIERLPAPDPKQSEFDPETFCGQFRIRRPNGEELLIPAQTANSYWKLVQDHKRKYDKHYEIYTKIELEVST